MDPITHLMTGACLSRAGFNRKTALATAAMTLAAEAPDLDVLYDLGGRLTGFQHHRGWTHTFLGTPVIAFVIVAGLYLWYRWRTRRGTWKHDRPPRWGLLLLFSWVAVMSHLLLDYTNNYGVRPFMPFDYHWFSWDIVFIIEPLLWLLLLGGLLAPLLFALIDSEIGGRKQRFRGRGAAIAALTAMVLLWGVRDFQHRRAVAALQSLTYDGFDAVRVSAYPNYLNPFRWNGVVETRNFFQVMEVNSRTGEVDPEGRARVFYKPEETPVTLAAKNSRLGRLYLDWAVYPIVEVQQVSGEAGGYLVRFRDLRFAYPDTRRSVLGAWVRLDANLNVLSQSFDSIRDRENRSERAQRTTE